MGRTAQLAHPVPLWFFENLAYVHLDGEQMSGAFHVGEVVARRGDMPPLHVHHRDDETFYLLEGELTLFLPGHRITRSSRVKRRSHQVGCRTPTESTPRPPVGS